MEKIAVLIPCYNEEMTIGKVIDDFKLALPKADIYVYDNNSSDATYEIAKQHGAIVKNEFKQGKGNVVRSMFRDIDADIYVMVDGDDTYEASFAPKLVEKIKLGADMSIGDRLSTTYYTENKKVLHSFGNCVVKFMINFFFGSKVEDIMTGFRAFSKRFVRSFQPKSESFEIETEMTLFALENGYFIASTPVDYRDRPEGSKSKVHALKDGVKIIFFMLKSMILYKKSKIIGLLAIVFNLFGIAFSNLICYIVATILILLSVIFS